MSWDGFRVENEGISVDKENGHGGGGAERLKEGGILHLWAKWQFGGTSLGLNRRPYDEGFHIISELHHHNTSERDFRQMQAAGPKVEHFAHWPVSSWL